ncbi:hypothetical protein CYY_003653 [Polysphondylium violaceum]|uniref:Uncharacterized protein n=1 Tax=Polysphondylium violaceum TaxID=133409 RepID=A0A8J4V0Y6_9MYCE|nr:hypothetical protein CYY_003653 [Polysphondylium violaceum]
MVKFLIALVLILTYCTIQSSAQTNFNGVGIWNLKLNIAIGVIDYPTSDQAVPKVQLPNLFYDDKSFQQSTFNNQTKVLTLIAQRFNNGGSVIYSIDTVAWKVIGSTSYGSLYKFGGLASDQTSGNGVYGVYVDYSSNRLGILNTITLSFANNNKASSVGSFAGDYRGSVYVPSSQQYYIAFTNTTGLFVKVFDKKYKEVQEKQSLFANNDFPVIDTPLNLVYDPQNDQIIANVQMQYSSTQVTCGLAYLDLNTFDFFLTNMYGYSGDYFLFTVGLTTSNIAYTFSIDFNGLFYVYKWNLFTGVYQTYSEYYTPILAAF